MKTINFLVSMVVAMLLLCGTSAFAQTQNVSSQAQLIAAVNAMKTSGGTIKLVAPFDNSVISGTTVPGLAIGGSPGAVNLSASAPITIDCGADCLSVYGNGTSGNNGNLIIGNNITVTGSGQLTIENSMSAVNSSLSRGAIEVANGGIVINEYTGAGEAIAINAGGGRSILDPGGTVMVTAPLGIGIEAHNSFTTVITGGLIVAEGAGATGLVISGTPGTNIAISGVEIDMTGTNSQGIYATGGWIAQVNNVTINTTSGNKSDKAIVADAGSVIQLTNPAIKSSIPYSGDGCIIDKNATITVTPSVAPGAITLPQVINFTATCVNTKVNNGAEVAVAAPVVASLAAADCSGTPPTSTTPIPSINMTTANTVYAAVAMVGAGTNMSAAGITAAYFPNPPASFAYTEGTGLADISIDKADAYIAGNVLYAPAGEVQLYGISGQLLLNTVATGAGIDVSTLDKGVYVVKAGTSTFKVIK